MYIWRKRNRRDRRNLLTSGPEYWGAPIGSQNTEANDEITRQQNEQTFVKSLVAAMRKSIYNYLNTTNGVMEINHVIHEIEVLDAPSKEVGSTESEKAAASDSMTRVKKKQKTMVKEVFRKYDADGSQSIDCNELKKLLKDLQLPISEKEQVDLFKQLDPRDEGSITFEVFYEWFDREASSVKKKNVWQYFISSGLSAIQSTFKRMLLEIEARNAIIDKVVYDTEHHAHLEFRKAHPPLYPCTHPNCFECFPNASKLQRHLQDQKLHRELDSQVEENTLKFQAVANAFQGNQGRRLHANRLLFSVDLADLKPRLHNLTEQPYRPHLSDPGSRREKQLRAGMFVLGADPKAGIRPAALSRNLRRQHRANCTLPPVETNVDDLHKGLGEFNKPNLRATLVELMQCRDQKIDTVIADELGARKEVRFEWKGYVHSDTEIMGEFNGWRPEKLFPDGVTGRLYIIKKLCAGRYRYRYIVNGEEAVDPYASQITDNGVVSNVLLIVNPPVQRPPRPVIGPDPRLDEDGKLIDKMPPTPPKDITVVGINAKKPYATRDTIDLRNTRMCDDGAWALTVSIQMNSVILHLDLSFNDISDTGIGAVAIAVERLAALRTLKLNGNGFSSDGVAKLVRVLKPSTTIKVLELCSNRIGDDGAEFLAERFLKYHTSIEELYLDSNLIGNDGAAFIGDGLLRNRSLKKLSLCDNRIYPFGAERLCIDLRKNGYLSVLKLANNPLGPLGVKSVGDLLSYNDSLQYLDISNCHMLRNNDVQGYHSLNFALKKNKGLRHLVIRNNGLKDDNIMELGYALSRNKGLQYLDADNNFIPDKWFASNTYIDTKLIMQMPSIQTSLDRNIEMAKDPILGSRYAVKPREMEEGFTGIWTNRRIWTAKDREGEFLKAKQKQALAGEEGSRMQAEDNYVTEHSMIEMDRFQSSLTETPGGRRLVKYVSKIIELYIKSLEKLSVVELNDHQVGQQSTKTVDSTMSLDGDRERLLDDSLQWISQSHLGILSAVFEGKGADQRSLNLPFAQVPSILEELCVPVTEDLLIAFSEFATKKEHKVNPKKSKKKKQLIRERSNKNDNMTTTAVADDINADAASGVTHQFANMDALSANDKDVGLLKRHLSTMTGLSEATGTTGSRPGTAMEVVEGAPVLINYEATVDFQKFVRTFAEYGADQITTFHYQHLKLRALNFLKSKRALAANILMRSMHYSTTRSLRAQYRKMPDKEPKYLCEECNERFHSQSSLDRHKAKRVSHHRKYYHELNMWRSREVIIREAKFMITGQRFPMYYKLRDALTLPRDFYPQVYDRNGEDGRPIGVVEPEHLVRVNDVVGDWLQIAFDGGSGWMIFKSQSLQLMYPALQENPRFWKNLMAFHEPVFYYVRFELPEKVEIKVRYEPETKSAVCGSLKPGMVVSCGAILDEKWMEIRYNNIDAAWVLCENSAGIELLRRVDDTLQMPFLNTLKKSPIMMTPEDLLPIEPTLMEDEDLVEEDVTRPNTATSVGTSRFGDGDYGDLLG